MYEQHYRFSEKPFGLTPDPKYLYASNSHVKALETLQQAIARRECFAVVTGDVGTGKTTLCRALVDQSDRKTFAALLLNPPASEEELITETLSRFGIVSRGQRGLAARAPTRQALVNTLHDFLLSLPSFGATAVLIVDEAQNVSPPILDQVRILANLTGNKEILLQVVLAGQLTLPDLLHAPELRHLDQRLSVRCELKPLTEDETSTYILQRLAIADPTRSVTFTPAAARLVHRCSGGVPRLVNLICHRALLAGFTARAMTIEAGMVDAAVEGLDVSPVPATRKSWFARFRRA